MRVCTISVVMRVCNTFIYVHMYAYTFKILTYADPMHVCINLPPTPEPFAPQPPSVQHTERARQHANAAGPLLEHAA